MGRPKTYDEALRNRLLDEAAKMLSTDGYRSVSLRTITNLADTSTNAVYTLFGSKEALMAEVILRDLHAKMVPVIEAQDLPDPEAALMAVTRSVRELAVQNPHLFTGAFEAMAEARESSSLTDRLNPAVKEIDKELFAPISHVCHRIAEQSSLRLNPQRMAMTLWAALHGYIVLELAEVLPAEQEIADEVFDELVYSLYAGWTAADLAQLSEKYPRDGK